MKTIIAIIFGIIAIIFGTGCAGTYERTVIIPEDSYTRYAGGVESLPTMTYKGTFNLLGRAQLSVRDTEHGTEHLHDSNMEKALSVYQATEIAKVLEQGLTARHKIDGDVTQAGMQAKTDRAVIDGARTINPETQAVEVVRP